MRKAYTPRAGAKKRVEMNIPLHLHRRLMAAASDANVSVGHLCYLLVDGHLGDMERRNEQMRGRALQGGLTLAEMRAELARRLK